MSPSTEPESEQQEGVHVKKHTLVEMLSEMHGIFVKYRNVKCTLLRRLTQGRSPLNQQSTSSQWKVIEGITQSVDAEW